MRLLSAYTDINPCLCSPLTCFTTGSTQGFALLSLYAPMPRSTLFESLSARYAAINPNYAHHRQRSRREACEVEYQLQKNVSHLRH